MDERQVIARAEQAIESEDYELAVELLKPLVAGGNSSAMSTMGLLYQHGFGVARDLQTAITLFEKAAALGNGYAAHNLGTLYSIGLEGKPDLDLSRRWYLKARDLGIILAPDSWYESLSRPEGGAGSG